MVAETMTTMMMEKHKGDVIPAKCDAGQHQLQSEEIRVLVLCRVLLLCFGACHFISEPYSSFI